VRDAKLLLVEQRDHDGVLRVRVDNRTWARSDYFVVVGGRRKKRTGIA